MPDCKSCGLPFDDYRELAVHIAGATKGHYKGKKWAAKYLLINGLSAKSKSDQKERVQLTDEDRENKESTHRELSGDTEVVPVWCPRHRGLYKRVLEVEYIYSPTALNSPNGYLQINCVNCGGKP